MAGAVPSKLTLPVSVAPPVAGAAAGAAAGAPAGAAAVEVVGVSSSINASSSFWPPQARIGRDAAAARSSNRARLDIELSLT